MHNAGYGRAPSSASATKTTLRTVLTISLWLGYGGFSLEVLALYFKTVGTLLGSSLFFFAAGFIVIALAAVAYRLHARMEAQS